MSNSQVASQSSWTNVAELGAVAASFGGTVAAVLMQQVAFAAVPLSLAAALSICNRRQAVKQLSREVVHLQSELNLEQQKLLTLKTKSLGAIQEKLNSESLQFSLQIQEFNSQMEEIQLTARNLRTVQNCTQHLLDVPTAESFYARAVGHHRLGDFREAILDYGEAIKLNQDNAKAYFNRGIAHTNLDDKQKAVEDFREAAKVFFKEGNIGAYSKAKELSENMHQLDREQTPEAFDKDMPMSTADADSMPSPAERETANEPVAMESLFA